MPIREYVIKSSWNSAYNSSSNSIDLVQLTKTINRGCRYLTFDVYGVKGRPEVGFSTNMSNKIVESTNTLSLGAIFSEIAASAFAPPCPNPNDPLFISLHIKSDDDALYSTIDPIIQKSFSSILAKSVTPNTKLSDICGKVIIVLDGATSPTSQSDMFSIMPSVSFITGNTEFPQTSQEDIINQQTNPPQKDSNGVDSSVSVMQCSVPAQPTSVRSPNPNYVPILRDYGVQIIPFRFYKEDSELLKYESFFSDNGGVAFVTMATAISYLHRK